MINAGRDRGWLFPSRAPYADCMYPKIGKGRPPMHYICRSRITGASLPTKRSKSAGPLVRNAGVNRRRLPKDTGPGQSLDRMLKKRVMRTRTKATRRTSSPLPEGWNKEDVRRIRAFVKQSSGIPQLAAARLHAICVLWNVTGLEAAELGPKEVEEWLRMSDQYVHAAASGPRRRRLPHLTEAA
jgi:hypothetical protein